MNTRKILLGGFGKALFLITSFLFAITLIAWRWLPQETNTDLGFIILDGNAKDSEWSPNGEWIAYPRRDPTDWYYDVWLIQKEPKGKDLLIVEYSRAAKDDASLAEAIEKAVC